MGTDGDQKAKEKATTRGDDIMGPRMVKDQRRAPTALWVGTSFLFHEKTNRSAQVLNDKVLDPHAHPFSKKNKFFSFILVDILVMPPFFRFFY